jgi:two-component sensor histidine kinase
MHDEGQAFEVGQLGPAGPAAPDFGLLFETAPAAMLVLAADPPRFTMVAVNAAHSRAFGSTKDEILGRGLFEVFPEPLTPATSQFVASVKSSLARVLDSGLADEMSAQPYTLALPNGATEQRYWGATHSPVRDQHGRMTHILSTVRDLTAEANERRLSEARALLMREVDHRARNALTIVQSLVRLTQARSLPEFKSVVLGRVEALARAQTSLARRKWEGAQLLEVVTEELASLTASNRYRVGGPDVLLHAEQVQAMSMALHELATNANKYGALGAAAGQVDVSWSTEARRLTLVWSEDGGPCVTAPANKGFGSRLLERLAKQLGGDIRRQWRPEGLRVELTATIRD